MKANLTVATDVPHREAGLLVQSLFNACGGIKAGKLLSQFKDTDYRYDIVIDAKDNPKLTKADIAHAVSFTEGFLIAFKAM